MSMLRLIFRLLSVVFCKKCLSLDETKDLICKSFELEKCLWSELKPKKLYKNIRNSYGWLRNHRKFSRSMWEPYNGFKIAVSKILGQGENLTTVLKLLLFSSMKITIKSSIRLNKLLRYLETCFSFAKKLLLIILPLFL